MQGSFIIRADFLSFGEFSLRPFRVTPISRAQAIVCDYQDDQRQDDDLGHDAQEGPETREKQTNEGGPHSTMDSVLASHPAAPGSILGVPKIFSEKF